MFPERKDGPAQARCPTCRRRLYPEMLTGKQPGSRTLLALGALILLCADSLLCSAQVPAQPRDTVTAWVTNHPRTQLLDAETLLWNEQAQGAPGATTITVDPAKTYQVVDGFGFALTGGSAQLLHRMDPATRHALLEELFGQGAHDLRVSYLRVTVGASDMNDHVYTYDDLPAGAADPQLVHFSLAEDEKDVVPVLKEVLAISPKLQILASPWTAPSWMKTNGLPKGGSLKTEDYPVYAEYLVRYLRQMQTEGIPIAALTMQNEPLNPKNTPSMVMEPAEQEAFLRDALGPALLHAGLRTKVVLYDHNCDRPDYPLTVLGDPKARAYAAGSGFHLYGGEISAMTQVHDAYPDKGLYFTEQMVVEHTREGVFEPVASPVSHVLIGAMRNWARTVLLWNLAADPSLGPHTNDGGCPVCQGAVTLDGNKVERNIALYTVAHASKFVPPGSVRIDSTQTDPELANVAWQTPQGRHVLLVANTSSAKKNLMVSYVGRTFTSSLDEGGVVTFVW